MMIHAELVEQFSRGKGILFVGAGFSVAAGLPGWGAIIEPLRNEIPDCPSDTSYTDIAQYYEVLNTRHRLIERILDPLRKHVEPTALHDALLQLDPSVIFTTNYDQLIEAAARRQGIMTQTIARNAHARSGMAKLQVIKVHGDIGHEESIVITTKDYLNFYHTRKAIADRLKVELQYKTPLFLGYSFRDWNLAAILAQIEHEAGTLRPSMYCVQFQPTPLVTAWLKDQGLTVIPLSSEPGSAEATEELRQWLEDFGDQVAATREGSSARTPALPHNLRERPTLLDRVDDLEATFKGLRSRYPLIALQGFPGVGKTSLALEVGHCSVATSQCVVADAPLFKFVVWISAEEETDQRICLNDLLRTIAAVTRLRGGVRLSSGDHGRMRKEVEELLASSPVLIIVDHHETIEDAALDEWLENIPSPSKVLITTTSTEPRAKAWPVPLEGLPPADCISLMQRHAQNIGLRPRPSQDTLEGIAKAATGNPQAMKLALGLIRDGRDPADIIVDLSRTGADVFHELLQTSWSQLGEAARDVVRVTPLFQGMPSMRQDALAAASGLGADEGAFAAAIEQCVRLGLLEPETDDQGERRYKVHSITRSFAMGELQEDRTFEAKAAGRITAFYRHFVGRQVIRSDPSVPYWNALVSDGMRAIDPEWPIIRDVINREYQYNPATAVDLTMLLVHYLDSRFLNADRIAYVEQAVAWLHQQGRLAEEALIRIDALSWTQVEEGQLGKAKSEVEEGLLLAAQCQSPEREDLLALGKAWSARIDLEGGDLDNARKSIEAARAIGCSPWIEARVNLAFGDIALRAGETPAALEAYLEADKKMKSYGGEGDGYQMLPRIGLALLEEGRLEEAEATFRQLRTLEEIAIGRLYADFGLALVELRRGHTEAASALLERLRDEIGRSANTNLLWKMIDDVSRDVEKRKRGLATPQPRQSPSSG